MEEKNNEIEYLYRCSFCGDAFNQRDLVLLEGKDQKTTFYANCPKCKTSSLILVMTNQGGIFSLGMATDLDRDEAKKNFSTEPISADEVLDIHQFISGYGGNISEIVKEGK